MEGSNVKISQLPPGFRFHPTDEELIMHYLLNQAQSRPCPVSIIPEIDIYKVDPWELPVNAELGLGENEWYFFSPRERKYPNGVRPNRAAVSGYWKATGTDKAINSGSKCVGVKKALVFYKGRPPKGTKTDWIMHEYRLGNSGTNTKKQKYGTSMRLDDWVLCRIYKKRHLVSVVEEKEEDSCLQVPTVTTGGRSSDQQQSLMFPRTVSLSYLLELEYFSSSNVLSDTSLMSSTIGFQTSRKDMEKIQPDSMFNSTKLVTEMSTQHLNLCDLGVFKHEN